jgi:hypothetical protein
MKDTNTRAVLAYFWSVIAAFALGYIIVKHGNEKEILTLIIGLIGGTVLGGIFGVYFSANHGQKPAINQQADTITNSPAVGTDATETES